jgi:calcineurin-like phosphoesterase family protein
MIWFTSDLHLKHPSIIHLGNGRPFDSLQRMEAYLIDAINDHVSPDDTLWVLGDFYMRGTPGKVAPYLERIACADVRLVRGNHDRLFGYGGGGFEGRRFSSVSDYAELADPLGDGSRFVLSHYPMLDWDRMYHGSYMLHGHIHSWPAGDAAKFVGPRFVTHEHGLLGYNGWNRANGIRRYDVGVDANGYAPVSMDDIVAFFEGMELACLGAKEGEWA